MKGKVKSRHCIVFIIIFALFFATTYSIVNMILSQTFDAIRNESEEYMEDSLNQRIANINSSLKMEWRFLETFSNSLDFSNEKETNYERIYEKIQTSKTYYGLKSLSLIEEDYTAISTRNWNPFELSNIYIVKRAFAGNKGLFINNKSDLIFSFPVYTDEKVQHIILMELDRKDVLDRFRISEDYTEDYYALVNTKGSVLIENKSISSGDISNVLRNTGASQKEILQLFISINNKMNRKIDLETKSGDIASVHIRTVEDTSWLLVTVHSCSAISTLSKRMRYEIIIIVAIIIALALIIVLVFNMCKNSVISNLEFDNRSLYDEQNELKKISEKDPFTEVYNKNTIMKKINEEINNNELQKSTLFMVDLDKFKLINDTYGHIVGDEVLVEFSKSLKYTFGSHELIGRIGGDEFVVYKIGCVAEKEIEEYAQKLINRIGEIKVDGVTIGLSATIGIAKYPEHGRDFQDLLLSADKAMYELKNNDKRGNFRIYCKK